MKKLEKKAWDMRNVLVAKVFNCSPFCIPTIGNSSGKSGDATEVGLKCEVGCYKSAAEGVADIGRADMYKWGIDPETGKKRRYSFEIKTRCGTIGVNSAKGYQWKADKYDFFVYFIDRSDFSVPLYKQCIVISSQAFMQAVKDNNLLHYHYKKGEPNKTPENSIKCNLQTYYTSIPRYTNWKNSLEFEGMDWELFAQVYQIKW